MNQLDFITAARAEIPEPGTDAVSHLAHVVAAFKDSANADFAIHATYGVFGDGVDTGLTWGDLRELLAMVKQQ